jgi:hypothetical protein
MRTLQKELTMRSIALCCLLTACASPIDVDTGEDLPTTTRQASSTDDRVVWTRDLDGETHVDEVAFADGFARLAGDLPQCIAACKAGPDSIEAFCRSLPDPRLRAGCWAVVLAGEVACTGWCYLNF